MADLTKKDPRSPQTDRASGAFPAHSGFTGSQPVRQPRQLTEQAQDLKDQAVGLADAATQEVKELASGLADTVVEVASDAGAKLRGVAEEQKTAGAYQVSRIARAIRTAADDIGGDIPQVSQYVRLAAEQVENVSVALQRRNVGELVAEAQNFARRHPTAFLGATVLAGFALIRFLKTSSDGQTHGGSSEATQQAGSREPRNVTTGDRSSVSYKEQSPQGGGISTTSGSYGPGGR